MFGHEGMGTVVDKGKDVKDVEVGDCVATFWHPAYAQHYICPEDTYAKIPEISIDYLVQPAACALNVLDYIHPDFMHLDHSDKNILVIGSGYMALVLAQVVGDNWVFAGNHNKEFFWLWKRDLKTMADIKGMQFDTIIEMSSRKGVVQRIPELLKENGELIFVATPPAIEEVDFFPWSWKAATIKFPSPRSEYFYGTFCKTIDMVSKNELKLRPLYTHIYDWNTEFEKGFVEGNQRTEGYIKGVFKF